MVTAQTPEDLTPGMFHRTSSSSMANAADVGVTMIRSRALLNTGCVTTIAGREAMYRENVRRKLETNKVSRQANPGSAKDHMNAESRPL